MNQANCPVLNIYSYPGNKKFLCTKTGIYIIGSYGIFGDYKTGATLKGFLFICNIF